MTPDGEIPAPRPSPSAPEPSTGSPPSAPATSASPGAAAPAPSPPPPAAAPEDPRSDDDERLWSDAARDRALIVVLGLTLAAVVVLVAQFLDALLFASATAVVTWPVHERVLARCGGRPYLAAAVTTTGLLLLIVIPVSLLALWFVQEAVSFAESGVSLASSEAMLADARALIATLEIPYVDPASLDPARFLEPLQRAVITGGQSVARSVPNLLGSLFSAALDAFIYLFAVVTLYVEGPRFLGHVMALSPMRREHDIRLFEVFREFSTNLVVGSLVTSVAQGAVASLGYAIVGIPSLVLVTLLTSVLAFVPFVGTSLVWIPASIYTFQHQGPGWALFLVAWSVFLTGGVDNLLRPILLRGRSPIHPLLIFVAVLGGISWLGLPGALVGPVTMAMFLALYQLWREQPARKEAA